MRKKELYRMLKNLDAELQTRIDEQQRVLNFLCGYERNGIHIDYYLSDFGRTNWYAEFLYKNKLKRADLVFSKVYNCSFEVKDNNEESFIVCIKFKNEEREIVKYFKVEKATCKVMEITEFFKNEENNG